MDRQLSTKLLLLSLFSVICISKVTSAPEGFKFPESATLSQDSINTSSEAGKVIEEILSASRAGRDLRLSVGDKDLEPLASDPQLRALSTETGKDSEARSYVATKLCSLGLAKCGEERHGGGQYDHGLTNIRDVTLVQPVALKPVGHPIAAIPLEKPFSSIGHGNSYESSSFGGHPSENKNFPSYQSQQGGFIQPGCTCVLVNQCNSYDIVNAQPTNNGNGIINGIGRPNHGQIGAGIDPRNKKSDIESNSTIIESVEPNARSARSNSPAEVEIVNSSSFQVNETRVKRDVSLLPSTSNSRVINGAYQQGCPDGRYVCCRNPIRNPSYPSSGSAYPSTGSSYPNTGSSYPNTGSSYPNTGSSYPNTGSYRPPQQDYPVQGPVSNQYYPSGSNNNGICGKRNTNGINGRVVNANNGYVSGAAEFGEYPWQVAVLKKEGGNNLFVCGGSIIDSRHGKMFLEFRISSTLESLRLVFHSFSCLFSVLTAAHCIKSNRPEDIRVRLGEWDVNSENEFYPNVELDVAAIAIHPEYYAGNLVNDIAIIKLNGFVDFSRYPHISPICLPQRHHDFTGLRCYATGWGKDAFGQAGKFQQILQEVDVPIMNHRECEQRLKGTRLGPDFSLHQGFLCAGGEPDKDTCKGILLN